MRKATGRTLPTVELEFTRHARNRMRQLGVTPRQVVRIVERGERIESDASGRPRFLGRFGDDTLRVVLALDRPNLVITLHRRRK